MASQTVIGYEAMYVAFLSNFAVYIVCRRYKPCEFPGFVWTSCWGNKSYYVITSPANSQMEEGGTDGRGRLVTWFKLTRLETFVLSSST